MLTQSSKHKLKAQKNKKASQYATSRVSLSKPKLGLEVWGRKGVFRSFSRHPKTFRDCRLLVKKLDRNVWLLLESVADLTEGDQGARASPPPYKRKF